MKYKYILFDLDGTLTDSKEGITKSVQYALRKSGIEEENLDNLEKFIGPPLYDAFIEYYNLSVDKALDAVTYYREYFRENGIFENKLYDNIPRLLNSLKEFGLTLIVATSKPTEFSEQILEHFSIYEYFDDVVGSNFDGTRGKKSEVIKFILDKYNIDRTEVVMVGDRKYDIIGARENNIDSIGAAYGYGTLKELENEGAYCIAKSVMDIEKLIINNL